MDTINLRLLNINHLAIKAWIGKALRSKGNGFAVRPEVGKLSGNAQCASIVSCCIGCADLA